MKTTNRKANERGVALMMTLGILALLLIMAMSFAYTARTERLAAGINTDLISARLLAQSGVERAIGFLREQYRNDSYPGAAFYVPGSPESELGWLTRGGRYLASVSTTNDGIQAALSSTIRVGNSLYAFTPESQLHGAIGWIPIMVNHGAGVDSCIGLVAYLVIDETGKIDPNTALGTIYGENSEATGSPAMRLGVDPKEIALADLYAEQAGWTPPYSYGDTVGEAFRTQMPSPGRWFSLYDVMNRFSGYGVNQDWLNRLVWSVCTESPEEDEGYRLTATTTDVWHRCNINDVTVWDGLANDIAGLPVSPVLASAPYTAAVGVPWFAEMRSEAGDVATQNQIRANIVDFLDADSLTTSDYAPGATGVGTATYVGLEEVPYINEVLVRARCESEQLTLPMPPIPIGYNKTIFIEASIEYVNLYATAADVPHTALELEVRFQLTTVPTYINRTVTISWPSLNVGAGQHVATSWVAAASFTQFCALPTGPNVLDFQVLNARVVAAQSSPVTRANLLDFAHIEQGSMANPGGPATLVKDGDFVMASAEVDDPRANTSGTGPAENWDWSPFSAQGGAAGTRNAVNSRCNPIGPDYDAETATNPTLVSTRFISNGPLDTFWQLGAIHRGEKWRTVNIGRTDLSAARGTYAYGDWELLNQVKLTANLSAKGLVNLWARANAYRPTAPFQVAPGWKPLIQNIRVGTALDSPATGGTALAVGSSFANGDAMLNFATSLHLNPALATVYMGRAAVVTNVAFRDASCGVPQTTDAAQEEIIGKVVGLLTDRTSSYTVLVCAKAVQDIGLAPTGMTTIPTDWIAYQSGPPPRYCRPLAEQKVLASVVRDVVGNRFWVRRFEYLEE